MATPHYLADLSRRQLAIARDDAGAFLASFDEESPFGPSPPGQEAPVSVLLVKLIDADAVQCCAALANLMGGRADSFTSGCARKVLDRLNAGFDIAQHRKDAAVAEAILEAEHGRAFIEMGGGLLNAARPFLARAAMERPRALHLYFQALTAPQSDALASLRDGELGELRRLMKSNQGELDRAIDFLLLAAWSCDSLVCFGELFDWGWSKLSDGSISMSEKWGRLFDRFVSRIPRRPFLSKRLDAFFVQSTVRMLEAWVPTPSQIEGFLRARERNDAARSMMVRDGVDEYRRRFKSLQERDELLGGLAPMPAMAPRRRRGALGAAPPTPADPSPPGEDG